MLCAPPPSAVQRTLYEATLASSEADDLQLGLYNEMAVEAEIHSVFVAEVAIETSDLSTAPPNCSVIQLVIFASGITGKIRMVASSCNNSNLLVVPFERSLAA